MTTVVINHIYS